MTINFPAYNTFLFLLTFSSNSDQTWSKIFSSPVKLPY